MTTLRADPAAADRPWTANDGSFGARLALIRQHCGWGNLKEAAVACGIPVESWRAWERDGAQPRRYLEVCAQIAAVVGCDYGWLVDRRVSGTTQPSAPKVSRKLRAIAGMGTLATMNRPLLSRV